MKLTLLITKIFQGVYKKFENEFNYFSITLITLSSKNSSILNFSTSTVVWQPGLTTILFYVPLCFQKR